ncbi:hypothetical protein JMN32_08565 [Fulvivirga sp. 29W222]|uniref:Uncharacterized protein n=1 Tax=Fulvivirga marina TaxID=2494733 RepID=A0A937KDL5_9BACT|nr:hypothetical protein [Fulvivirga marina]MBL6446358.1 hypothetical protein [Fulvivirga marina]
MHKSQLSQVEKKLEGIEERFVIGEIERPLYDQYASKFREEKLTIEQKIENSAASSSN